MITICSRDNKMLKLARSLQKKKNRYAEGLYFAEGVRIVGEALRDAKKQIRAVLIAEEFAKKHEDFVKKIDIDDKLVYTVKDHLFAGICDTETPQGVGVLLKMPQNQADFAEKESFILALDGVSEPGNLGTMIRTAEAAGVSEEILSRADQRVRIPMQGKVESLNAAVAAGIAMYQIRHNTI